MTLLITFTVKDDRTHKLLVGAIAHYGDCIQLAQSSYALKTTHLPALVYDGLHIHLGPDDMLVVLAVDNDVQGGSDRVRRWFKAD